VKKFKEEGDEMADYIRKLIAETQLSYDSEKEPTNYIHAFMKEAEKGTGSYFNETQLMASVSDLFMAGTDTAAGTMLWGLFFMAKHPEIQDRIYRELAEVVGTDGHLPQLVHRSRVPYTEAAITEMQRIATLAPMSAMHKATADTDFLGYKIPKDAYVLPFLWNVLQNPENYKNPEEFIPDRFLDEQGKLRKDPMCIPFSTGKRACPGESLAKMELYLFFSAMILKFRFSFPANAPDPILKRHVGFTSSLARFELRLEPRV